jgi:hypothetical protein
MGNDIKIPNPKTRRKARWACNAALDQPKSAFEPAAGPSRDRQDKSVVSAQALGIVIAGVKFFAVKMAGQRKVDWIGEIAQATVDLF